MLPFSEHVDIAYKKRSCNYSKNSPLLLHVTVLHVLTSP